MSPTKYVYDFSEGNASMKPLLGGKEANLAEMTGLGIPVPQVSPSPLQPASTTPPSCSRWGTPRKK